MIVAAMYLLIMLGKVVWGTLKEPASHHGGHGHGSHGTESHNGLPADLCAREIGILIPLAVLCIALGVYPKPLLDTLEQPVGELVRKLDEGRLKVAEGSMPSAAPSGRTLTQEVSK
jgi:NADH:ubiquinone oxidoreductase subunit 4 (subunit M)